MQRVVVTLRFDRELRDPKYLRAFVQAVADWIEGVECSGAARVRSSVKIDGVEVSLVDDD
jgi:hypothetical protein